MAQNKYPHILDLDDRKKYTNLVNSAEFLHDKTTRFESLFQHVQVTVSMIVAPTILSQKITKVLQ